MNPAKILGIAQTALILSAVILIVALRETLGFNSVWVALLFFLVADIVIIVGLFWLNPLYRDLVQGAWNAYISAVRNLGVRKNDDD